MRPSKSPLWDGARLPNHGSPWQTPTTLLIDLRYEQLRIWSRWNWERFTKFCNFLDLTPGELASIALIPHSAIATFERRNRVMQGPSPNRAAAMVLTLLEAHCVADYSDDLIKFPFPNLGEMKVDCA